MSRRYKLNASKADPACASLFLSSLDRPSPAENIASDQLVLGGWLSPRQPGLAYSLRVLNEQGEVGVYGPNHPRPDVVKKLGVVPLPGDDVFKGFNHKLPVSDWLSIYVDLGGKSYLWKHLDLCFFDEVREDICRKILSGRELSADARSAWLKAETSERLHAGDSIFSETRLIEEDGIARSSALTADEKKHFGIFAAHVNSPGFASLVLSAVAHGHEVSLPDPFHAGRAVLVGSFFSGANFLAFRGSRGLFYIGQFLHSVDFVYFPSHSLCLRASCAHYDPAHLRSLTAAPADIEGVFSGRSIDAKGGKIDAILINGVSPYHYFYDCLPALQLLQSDRLLAAMPEFKVINGSCYFPVEVLVGVDEELRCESVSVSELDGKLGSAGAMFLVGLSHRRLPPAELDHFDRKVVASSYRWARTPAVNAISKELQGCNPVLWVGISEQKRAWKNQDAVLAKLVPEILKVYPGACFILDGMTSSVFGEVGGADYYDADRRAVERLMETAFRGVKVMSAVGLTSMEKIVLAQSAHYFLASYSTGSMYPSRFARLPGLAHSSKRLYDQVKDIHVHHRAVVFPLSGVCDFEDPQNSRVDFISYSVDEKAFIAYAMAGLVASVPA